MTAEKAPARGRIAEGVLGETLTDLGAVAGGLILKNMREICQGV
jgi:hypothetical protein